MPITQDRAGLPLDFAAARRFVVSEDQAVEDLALSQLAADYQVPANAFLSADRVRGQATYLLLLDEFQDLLKDHIPVIEPSTSHAPPGLEKRP